jgi:hypothetical protein
MNRPLMTLACTGKSVRLFQYKMKMETVYSLPDNYPDALAKEDSLAGWFARYVQLHYEWNCLGCDVRQLKERYNLRLAKEDVHYAYITASPRISSDMSDISQITFAIGKKDFLTHGTLVLEAAGNTMTSNYTEIKTNATPPVNLEMIQANLPQGWEIQKTPNPFRELVR